MNKRTVDGFTRISKRAAEKRYNAGEPVQVGYVITGKTDFQDDFGRWSGQYIDLWIEILSVSPVDFEGEAA